MPITKLNSAQVAPNTVQRTDLNTTVPGQAVITRIIAGTGVTLTQTGTDTGTGVVTISG